MWKILILFAIVSLPQIIEMLRIKHTNQCFDKDLCQKALQKRKFGCWKYEIMVEVKVFFVL